MKTVNIREANTFLFRLGEQLVKISTLNSSSRDQVRRLGFLTAQTKVSEDFDRMADKEITLLFGTEDS